MANAIQWTDFTKNAVGGCTKSSPGCDNCYAMRMASRQMGMKHELYAGTVTIGRGAHWTGRLNYDGELLRRLLLGHRKPAKVFCGSMSDLCHEQLPYDVITDMWEVFRLCSNEGQVTLQVLTKRAKRLRNICHRLRFTKRLGVHLADDPQGLVGHPLMGGMPGVRVAEPLARIWLGVTGENQEYYNRRTRELKLVKAAVRFVSCEPLLERIELTYRNWMPDWVIIGPETGSKPRRCEAAWVRDMVDQCGDTHTPCFVKKAPKGPEPRGGWPQQFPTEPRSLTVFPKGVSR